MSGGNFRKLGHRVVSNLRRLLRKKSPSRKRQNQSQNKNESFHTDHLLVQRPHHTRLALAHANPVCAKGFLYIFSTSDGQDGASRIIGKRYPVGQIAANSQVRNPPNRHELEYLVAQKQ